jgi:hypothetical protein
MINRKGFGRKSSAAKSRHYSGSYLEGLRKTTKNLRITWVSAEIRTEHLPNMNIGHCRYTNPLDNYSFEICRARNRR